MYNSSKLVPTSNLEPVFESKRTRASPNKVMDSQYGVNYAQPAQNHNVPNPYLSKGTSFPMNPGYAPNYQNMPIGTSNNYYMGHPQQMQGYPIYPAQGTVYHQPYINVQVPMSQTPMKSNSEMVQMQPQNSLSSKNINYGPGSTKDF